MDLHDWLTLASCAGHLTLAFLVAIRGAKSPLARPLVFLCIDFFSFNAAALAQRFSDSPGWEFLDSTASSLLGPFVLHFMLVFVGRQKTFRRLLAVIYGVSGALALSCALAFFVAPLRSFPGSRRWAVLLLCVAIPLALFVLWLLLAHLRRVKSPLERVRTQIVVAAFTLGTIGCVSELLADLGIGIPRLGYVGTLVSTLLLAVVTLRFGLLERRVSSLLILSALAVASLQVLAYLGVYHFLGDSRAMLILGTVTVTLALVPGIREVVRTASAHRQRLEYLATLGRFSAQMAHDLRNPLAAIQGAAQFLETERARGSSLAERGNYFRIILGQSERLGRVIAEYQRLGRVEPSRTAHSLNDLVRTTLASQELAAPPGVSVATHLADKLVPVSIDSDLFAGALENLVRNAFEAMAARGGTLTVATRSGDPERSIVVSVEDSGPGMDARTSARVFEDFFTTKAQGSGLGLAFVRRVVEAHGGEVSLSSEEGRGTAVELRFPIP